LAMRISSKCSLALHILVALVVFSGEKLTSERLAKSTGCNPVMVRNILGSLKKAGLITVQRGIGGTAMKADPRDITIWTVYEAVDPISLNSLIGLHPTPSQRCPIGKNIYTLLEKPYDAIGEAVQQAMSTHTLEQLIDDYRNINSAP